METIEKPRAASLPRRLTVGQGRALATEDLLGAIVGRALPPESRAALTRMFANAPLRPRTAREFKLLPGVGSAGAARLLAAQELCRRWLLPQELDTPLATSGEVFARFRHIGLLDVESFWVVALDPRLRMLHAAVVCRGTRARCLVRPADALAPVLREGASAFLILHNHPSGDPEPSSHDIALTRRMVHAAEVVGVRLVDHVVVARGGYVSLAERGVVAP